MYGGDDNRMIVYYMERWPKKREREKTLERKDILEKSLLNTVNCVHQKYIIT